MRPFFTKRSVALLRTMNERNLTDMAVIWWMKSGDRDVNRDYPEVKTIEAVDVPCRLAPLDLRVPFELRAAQQFGTDAKWTVIFTAGRIVPHTRRLVITGVTNKVPWTQHLEVLGDIISDNEMLHRVACATLKDVKVQQYYAT